MRKKRARLKGPERREEKELMVGKQVRKKVRKEVRKEAERARKAESMTGRGSGEEGARKESEGGREREREPGTTDRQEA